MKKSCLLFLICCVSIRLFAQTADLDPFYKYFMNAQYDSARMVLEKRLEIDPDNPQLHFHLGKTYLALKKHDSAIQEFRRSLRDSPADTKVYECIGSAYEDIGMTVEAIEAYESSIRSDPSIPSTQLKCVSLYYNQHDYDASISSLWNFMKIDSSNMQAYYLLGRSYLKKAEHDRAIHVALQACIKDSSDFPNTLNLGIAYYNMENFENAEEALEKAVKRSPKSGEARYYLGQTYASIDQRADAKRHLEA
ncbi:MAG: tetratricopeptide repeat protein [bacterium]